MLDPSNTPVADPSAITITELKPGDDFTAFRTLNEEWISHYFVLEAEDRDQLEHPETLLQNGTHIYTARHNGEDVGCLALIPMPGAVYQVSKMAVRPTLRGLGIGRKLLLHAIDQAKRLGARSLFLGSNTKLASAVGLYEATGFVHVPPNEIPHLPYTRANIFMKLDLQ